MPLPPATTPHRCLWCGGSLPEPPPGTTWSTIQCNHCDRRNRREDLATFHTLRPEARRLQTMVEVLSALVLGGCVFACFIYWRHLKGSSSAQIVVTVVGGAFVSATVFYQSRYLTRRRIKKRRGGMLEAAVGVGFVAFAYKVFLGMSTRDLEGGGFLTVMAIATVVVAAMGLRIWWALRRSAA